MCLPYSANIYTVFGILCFGDLILNSLGSRAAAHQMWPVSSSSAIVHTWAETVSAEERRRLNGCVLCREQMPRVAAEGCIFTVTAPQLCLAQGVKNSDALRAAVDQVQEAQVALSTRLGQSGALYKAFQHLRKSSNNLTEVQQRILDGAIINAQQTGADIQVGYIHTRMANACSPETHIRGFKLFPNPPYGGKVQGVNPYLGRTIHSMASCA